MPWRGRIYGPALVLIAVTILTLGLAAAMAQSIPAAVPAGAAPADQRLELVVPLVADDAGLQQFARSVSTPGSALYGSYQPVPVLARRFGAPAAARARAVAFLRAAGAKSVAASPTGMFVQAVMTVAAAERTFAVRLARFRAPDGSRYIAPVARARARSAAALNLPGPLRGVATGVVGLDTRRVVGSVQRPHERTRVGHARAHAAVNQLPPSGYEPVTGTPRGCSAGLSAGGFTPNQYLTAYGFDPLRTAGLRGQGERVALIEIDGFRASDIQRYASCFGLAVPKLVTLFVGSGSRKALPPGEESTLDLEVLDSAAPNLQSVQIYENFGDAAEVNRSFVLPLITPGPKPQVVSASLGLCEVGLREVFGTAGINQVERDVELAAATGITIVASSGDSGSSGCQSQSGAILDQLGVQYPSSSPFVTGVGGTNVLLNSDNTLAGQLVWNDSYEQTAAGGGGFSQLFRRPGYQDGVVARGHRAVPDLALLGDVAPGYTLYCTAQPDCGHEPWQTVGGTSAGAPLLAGGIALVDQDLQRHDRRLLGFMNPLLYHLGVHGGQRLGIFSDVTAYGNDLGQYLPGGDAKPLGCCTAGSGFDAASGWGSPDLTALDHMAMATLPAAPDISVSIPGGQHPLRQRELRTTVHCGAPCRASVLAVVTIGSGNVLSAGSRLYRLPGHGSRTLVIRFSAQQLRRMRVGLSRHQAVEAEVFATEHGPDGSVIRFTAGRLARIRS